MIGLGTILNAGGILAGGTLGVLLKNALPQRISDTLIKAMGVCVLFIGLSGALENHHLGTIVGEVTTDEVLGNIFAHFCIGK